jgi:hypothetical protein
LARCFSARAGFFSFLMFQPSRAPAVKGIKPAEARIAFAQLEMPPTPPGVNVTTRRSPAPPGRTQEPTLFGAEWHPRRQILISTFFELPEVLNVQVRVSLTRLHHGGGLAQSLIAAPKLGGDNPQPINGRDLSRCLRGSQWRLCRLTPPNRNIGNNLEHRCFPLS